MSTKSKSSIYYYLCSFLLPPLILGSVLFSMGIYWGSDKTILASDAFHQYVIFAQALRNILHGNDSFFYTFTSGLGLNFYALISYYLGSFFSPLYYFFDIKSMPDAIYLVTLLKFASIGLSSFFSFKHIYKGVKDYLTLLLAMCFTLMSFLTSQLELNTWLDVFILIPLILLGFQHLKRKQQSLLYYFTLTLLFFQNYYFGYMMSLFLIIYFSIEVSEIRPLKQKVAFFGRFTFVSICAALTSAVMLLPTILDLKEHGETLSTSTHFFIEGRGALDLLAKYQLGAFDTTKFNAIPMIYVGILPLFLSCIFFTMSAFSIKRRLAYAVSLLIIGVSFYIEPLDLVWQGMHAPNMFLHRYAWCFSLLLILISFETLSQFHQITKKQLYLSFLILGTCLALPYINLDRYSFLAVHLLFLTLAILVAYFIIIWVEFENNVPRLVIISFLFIFGLLDVSLNTFYQIQGISNEWVFPSRSAYRKNLTAIDTLVKQTRATHSNFYRMEQLVPQTGNDSMKYNYYGISQFSSIRNRSSSQLLDRLGYKSDGSNLNLRYQNNTLLMDSLFNIKYNLSPWPLAKFGFSRQAFKNGIILYQNHYANDLAIMSKKVYQDIPISINTLDNQTRFLNHINQTKYNYFKEIQAKPVTKLVGLNHRFTVKALENSKDTLVRYTLKIPANQQVYLSLPHLNVSNAQEKNLSIRINQGLMNYTLDNTFSLFDLGYINEEKTSDVELIFPNSQSVSFDQPHFYALDIDTYQKSFTAIMQRKVTSQVAKNNIFTTYQAPHPSTLIYTIPYDRGWKAKVNGRSVTLRKIQNGLVGINIPSGKGKVVLTFLPYGLKTGGLISVLGCLLYFSSYYYSKKKRQA
ncbi:YfhO family protein [Streptococcus halichoeri]|uniref:YfhO family protein n=1 Tax=Streptococcus halichoeri TaxID=254785 RepID=UPI0013569840|nr:YfhO family protein [Streptococcus halichoeri]